MEGMVRRQEFDLGVLAEKLQSLAVGVCRPRAGPDTDLCSRGGEVSLADRVTKGLSKMVRVLRVLRQAWSNKQGVRKLCGAHHNV